MSALADILFAHIKVNENFKISLQNKEPIKRSTTNKTVNFYELGSLIKVTFSYSRNCLMLDQPSTNKNRIKLRSRLCSRREIFRSSIWIAFLPMISFFFSDKTLLLLRNKYETKLFRSFKQQFEIVGCCLHLMSSVFMLECLISIALGVEAICWENETGNRFDLTSRRP